MVLAVKNNMFFVTNRKIIFSIIGFFAVCALGALLVWQLVFGIEFLGGTIIEVKYEVSSTSVPDKGVVESDLNTLDLGAYSLRQSGTDGYLLRTRDISEEEFIEIRKALAQEYSMEVERRATVGPVIGEELRNKAFVAIGVVVLLIVFFVAFAFRNVRTFDDEDDEDVSGVSSWTYGFIAIFVLAHDILIPLGLFAVLGKFLGAEVDVLIVMALLTILGYSVNDTIVIFDRVRENLINNKEENIDEEFEKTVGNSLSQTYTRSINTSITTLAMVLSLLVFGGPTTMYFALTLAVGVFAGTYSSLALAAPLLVTAEKRKKEKLKNLELETSN